MEDIQMDTWNSNSGYILESALENEEHRMREKLTFQIPTEMNYICADMHWWIYY